MAVASSAHRQTTRPPLWRNVRVLRIAGQVLFVLVVLFVLREMWLNLAFGVRRIGIDLGFDFLGSRAGFSIKEGIEYSPNESFRKAFTVGFFNTVRVAAIGIVLATVLGLVMGVARLSPNWLVRKIAQVYVDSFRNVPVLVVIVFMFVGVLLALPAIGGGFQVPGIGFLSNAGTAVTWFKAPGGLGAWWFFLAAGAAAGWAMWRWRTRVNEATGQPSYRYVAFATAFVAIAGVGYLVTGQPLEIDVPVVSPSGFQYQGGTQLSPEFTALLLGLVLYTGTFIAEIVRGSIQAVSKGQKEAAEALGLTPFQQLRYVVLPQAMRIAIPPLNSQYLNLTKNSSLGVFIAMPELSNVSKTIINQAGRAFQTLIIVMFAYLFLSLTISFVMNIINRFVTRRGERR